MTDLETRVRVLEEKIEILRRALRMAHWADAQPAVDWADTQMEKASKGEFRYSQEPENDNGQQ